MLKESKLLPPAINLPFCKTAKNNNILNLRTYYMDS